MACLTTTSEKEMLGTRGGSAAWGLIGLIGSVVYLLMSLSASETTTAPAGEGTAALVWYSHRPGTNTLQTFFQRPD